jgi:hypothetical protein
MFRLQPKAKDRQKTRVPDDLRNAMQEVHSLVEEARRDSDVNIDFDDAIQIGPICGGRYKKKPSQFEFRYRPDGDRQKGTWYLDFHKVDIEDIADGRQTEVMLYCCTTPGCNSKFSKADGHCDCDYVKDPDFGTFEFPEAASKLSQRGVTGIAQGTNREQVYAILGIPGNSGGDSHDSILGYIWPWIKYHRDDCQLRFEFDNDDRIRNITILERDWVPGK